MFDNCLDSSSDRPLPPGRTVVLTAAGRSVSLSWTEPDDDGGCKIGNYIVEYYRVKWRQRRYRFVSFEHICIKMECNLDISSCTLQTTERDLRGLRIA